MKHQEQVLALFSEGKKTHEIAQALQISKGSVYMIIYRSGLKVGKGEKCKQAAIYSKTHGVLAASEKFGIKKEAIYHYRRVYRNEIQEALQLKEETK